MNYSAPGVVTRTDYAANGGDDWTEINLIAGTPSDPGWPLTTAGKAGIAAMGSATTGVMFAFSRIRPTDVTDGTSNTYLMGEKYADHDHYEDGQGAGDNESALIGDDRDITRWGGPAGPYPPIPDTPGDSSELIFGSAHTNGFNMAFCDGAVQTMNYTIDIVIHGHLCNRHDDTPINPKTL
jgi:prepilin-type processing-associated H-X9-DG protein